MTTRSTILRHNVSHICSTDAWVCRSLLGPFGIANNHEAHNLRSFVNSTLYLVGTHVRQNIQHFGEDAGRCASPLTTVSIDLKHIVLRTPSGWPMAIPVSLNRPDRLSNVSHAWTLTLPTTPTLTIQVRIADLLIASRPCFWLHA